MTISKGYHKAYLTDLFFPVNSMGQKSERKFPLVTLAAASSALNKLRMEAVEKRDEEGRVYALHFPDSPLEFTPPEARVLGELVSQVADATPSEASVLFELRDMFVV